MQAQPSMVIVQGLFEARLTTPNLARLVHFYSDAWMRVSTWRVSVVAYWGLRSPEVQRSHKQRETSLMRLASAELLPTV